MRNSPQTKGPFTRGQKADALQERLRQMDHAYRVDRLHLLENSFPDIVADARRFVDGTRALPWEFAVAFVDGELEEIQQRYNVQPSRHRPSVATVSTITDLFCEAAVLLYEQWLRRHEEDLSHTE